MDVPMDQILQRLATPATGPQEAQACVRSRLSGNLLLKIISANVPASC